MVLSDEIGAGENDSPLARQEHVCEYEEPDPEADGDDGCTFEAWLDRLLVAGMDTERWYVGGPLSWFEDFAYNSVWQKTSLRDRMKNDLALWDGRPYEYLHIGEQLMANLYAFNPDYLDWKRLRSVSREEWHTVVKTYYEQMYLSENSTHGYPVMRQEREQLLKDWCLYPNPLHERRRRLYPQIDDKY